MMLMVVEDLDDPRLADYRHLREPNVRARVERNAGIFTVEGWLSLEALAESPYPVRSALVAAQHADRVVSIVGAEGAGLSDAAMDAADHRVRIPMNPGTDSVNVATAAAITAAALYEQRIWPPADRPE